jgi:hypothetical protein
MLMTGRGWWLGSGSKVLLISLNKETSLDQTPVGPDVENEVIESGRRLHAPTIPKEV